MNKKGFISTSVIFAFFIAFLMLLMIIVTSYAQNRILMNQVKKDIKSNLVGKYKFVPSGIPLYNVVNVGDYVQMTPTSTSYEIDTTKTGYTGTEQKKLNPSELNLWRVIRKNDDGTIEMVSEYVSSVNVYFQGLVGYNNSVIVLNEVAKQYENNVYTETSRHSGYNAADITKYDVDTSLIKNAIKTLSTYKVGSTTTTTYWLAAKTIYNDSNTSTSNRRLYYGGGSYYEYYYVTIFSNTIGSGTNEVSQIYNYAIRPIVVLKNTLQNIEGSGTKESPYILP